MSVEHRSRLPAILEFLQSEHAHLYKHFEEDRRALMVLARRLKKAKPTAWLEEEQARIARLFKNQRRIRHLERRIATVRALLHVQFRFGRTTPHAASLDTAHSESSLQQQNRRK